MTQEQTTKLVDGISILRALAEAYRLSPGDKVSSETVRQKLGVSEQTVIDLVKKLEEREFIKVTWVGRRALLTITEDGIIVLQDS